MGKTSKQTVPSCSQAPIGQGCCCCRRCGMGGCDLRMLDCGCCLHARCYPLTETPVTHCPACRNPVRGLRLLPMVFDEIDMAQNEAAHTNLSDKKGKKRKNATIARLLPVKGSVADDVKDSELRTGRWTVEETAYCDKLIELFENGKLPIPEGRKLNDFLSGMLKSKPSRLTKKMKNARLSARQYMRTSGFIETDAEARLFSELETEFFASIKCNMEKAEIRFHMQKEWRELFSTACLALNHNIDADDWLVSIDEMERRNVQQKDAARMVRRKIMMGHALTQDAENPQKGVFIDFSIAESRQQSESDLTEEFPTVPPKMPPISALERPASRRARTSQFTSPYMARVIQIVQQNRIPFEHVDIWVPSFVSATEGAVVSNSQNCRLAFGGCATADVQMNPEGEQVPLPADEQLELYSFGEYSQKFSFDVGCGLPGRVYNSGVASWEQGIQNAPKESFERCGGARQWGLHTALGVPLPSPTVGRLVILFYSRYDRTRDQQVVTLLTNELAKFMPSPKWKLVVDIGVPASNEVHAKENVEISELRSLVLQHMPENKESDLAQYLPGFSSLRVLLNMRGDSENEEELLKAAAETYRRLKAAGRTGRDLAWMTARGFMELTKRDPVHAEGTPVSTSVQSLQEKQQQQTQELDYVSDQNPSTSWQYAKSQSVLGNTMQFQHSGATEVQSASHDGNFGPALSPQEALQRLLFPMCSVPAAQCCSGASQQLLSATSSGLQQHCASLSYAPEAAQQLSGPFAVAHAQNSANRVVSESAKQQEYDGLHDFALSPDMLLPASQLAALFQFDG